MDNKEKEPFLGQRLLTSKEAMLYLAIKNERTLKKYEDLGYITNVSIDRFAKYDKNELDNFINKKLEEKKTERKIS